jgi:hypothetical protein
MKSHASECRPLLSRGRRLVAAMLSAAMVWLIAPLHAQADPHYCSDHPGIPGTWSDPGFTGCGDCDGHGTCGITISCTGQALNCQCLLSHTCGCWVDGNCGNPLRGWPPGGCARCDDPDEPESCDGHDNNGDGTVDENCEHRSDPRPFGDGPPAGCNGGECMCQTQVWRLTGGGSHYGVLCTATSGADTVETHEYLSTVVRRRHGRYGAARVAVRETIMQRCASSTRA